MKVYVVTAGCYSDFGIVSIFRHKEDAEAYIKAFNTKWSEFNDIEEYEIDGNPQLKQHRAGMKPYQVVFDRDGNLERSIEKRNIQYDTEKDEGSHVYSYSGRSGQMYLHIWAKDEEHAIKIAADLRRMELAKSTKE